MKILMLADGMRAGGAETHIETLVQGLAAHGHDPAVFSCGGAIADRMERSGIPQFRGKPVGRSPLRFACAVRTVRRLIREGGFDVLHAHTRMGATVARVAVAGLPSPPVRIVTAHARFRINRFFRTICDWGERTIAVSEDLRAYLADGYRVPAEQVDVIPNGIDTRRFCPVETPKKRQDGEHTVLFVSRLDADCSAGAYLLCSVAPHLARAFGKERIRVQIAGSGSELDAIRRSADEVNAGIGFPVIRVISLRDGDDPPDLPDLYRSADLFVGVSRAAMEAAACGCAVLLCGNEGYGGVLDPDLPDAAAKNFCCRGDPPASGHRLLSDLLPLLQNSALLRSLGARGCRRMRRSFSSDRMAELTERSYRRALSSHRTVRVRDSRQGRGGSVCIGGYAGCGNLGDDAILSALIASLRVRGIPRSRIIALSGDPSRDCRRFGVRCFGRKNPLSVLRAIFASRLFVCGGGTLIQNRTGTLSLLYYLSLLSLARRLGCRTVYLGGIGPIRGALARRITGAVLRRTDALLLRDPLSVSFAYRLGVAEDRVSPGADPALLLPLPPPCRGLFLRASRLPAADTPYCCVSFRPSASGVRRSALIDSVGSLARRLSFRPVLIVTDRGPDAEFADRIARDTGWPIVVPRDASELLAWLGGARLTISGRLHPLILSARAGIPCAGIWDGSDDRKIPFFCAQVCSPILREDAPAGEWFRAIESVLARPCRVPLLRHRAGADASRIRSLIAD